VLSILVAVLALDNGDGKKEEQASRASAGPTAAAVGTSPPSAVSSSPTTPSPPIVKLAIDAVLNGESREIAIDDAGKPFRVTGDSVAIQPE
jgi:hypothetical protein